MNKKDTERRRRLMRARVAAFQHYVTTYSWQPEYEDYSDDTYLKDMLYGIGLSMDGVHYSDASGFDLFKQHLREALAKNDGSI